MDLSLQDKKVVVVGGSKGIGWAAARGFLQEGAKVAVISRSLDYLKDQDIGAKLNLLPLQADATNEEEVGNSFRVIAQTYGQIDVLVHNVGEGHPGNLESTTLEDWQANMELNFYSAVRTVYESLPLMSKAGGSMILIGAASGKQPTFGQLISNVTKGSLIHLTKSLAEELASKRITVNNICPGRILTEQWERKVRKQGISLEEFMDNVNRSIPMGRFGTPEEVADLVLFIASERARYITGQSISIDGGWVKSII